MLSNTALALVVAAGSVLVLLRLARLRPVLSPLVVPYALTAFALVLSRYVADQRLGTGLVLAPALVLVVRAVVLVFEAVFRRRHGMDPPSLLGSVVSVLLYGIGTALMAKSWLGVDLTPILATSAVVGAVVGLALQDTLGNLFAGIALHSEAPYRVGDWVRVGEKDGRVEEVSWRATRLRTWDGDALTVPNAELARRPVLNYSVPRTPHTRVLTIRAGFDVPPNRVLAALNDVFEQIDGVPPQPAVNVRPVEYQEFAIAYEVRYPVRGYDDYRRIEGEVNRLVWYHFRRHGIELPVPARNVLLRQADAPTEARDRAAARLHQALRRIDLFRPLTEAEVALAVRRFRPVSYSAGERILEEGDGGDSFFVIDAGQVDVVKTVAGVPRKVARLSEGQFFGEMALLTGEKRSASVVAATDVDLYTLDKTGFQDVLAANPEIAVEISAILTARREALHQAEGDATQKYDAAASAGDKQQRLLERIRSFFGL